MAINTEIQVFINPAPSTWAAILARPGQTDQADILEQVKPILAAVKQGQDAAVAKFNGQFGGYAGADLWVTANELQQAESLLAPALKQAIKQAATNIGAFHAQQISPPIPIETMPGVVCWRKSVGITRVGLYIPGGTAPLFSTVLMLGIPAQLAGCAEVILATPADQSGEINPAILFAAQLVGISKIYKAGGAQAIAALAFGTESLMPVNKIFGPGNQYVTTAKQLVNQGGIAIDMPAGPSEVLVYADLGMPVSWAAADLLSQAEHGHDSQVILVCQTAEYAQGVIAAIDKHLLTLGRQLIMEKALAHARFVVIDDVDMAIELINQYAAEHLILACHDAPAIAERITQAGSIFIGYYSPESVGDYASGTNHTLPTYGYASAYSGVSLDSFVKKITLQQLTPAGLQNIGPTVVTMAEAEQLDAHALAVTIRLASPVA